MKIDQYWDVTTIDIVRQGWHVEQHYAHLYWFQYLRFSPSYLLAKKARITGLTSQEKKTLPKDFNKVLETYDLLGDVHNTVFRLWWLKNGYDVFGVPYKEPGVQGVALVDSAIKPQKEDLNLFFQHLNSLHEHPQAGKSLVLSIPLNQSSKTSLSQIKALLEANKPTKVVAPKKVKPKLCLQGQRFNFNALMKGFGLLMFKAAFPQMEHWRLGVVAKLSDSYSPALDHMAPRSAKDAIEAGDRILMGKITYRALDKYLKIAENAARGKFPCSDPIDIPPFDWKQLNLEYNKTTKWEQRLLKRVLAKEQHSKSNITKP
ncbi:MAG: hypothetical protein B7Y05_13830 [Polynucleobacter sp. 24-46-87]|jgi:hypothetical protein|nr:MAG: hypothetical protein B7Y55_03165 [Polynucleobacter sp. 35-46-207]OYZ38841.1 MAG: hypothetical protein B7Y22_00935 [Polynucleobacter sp. 16-46-70]OZA11820.1 MAG: hypothetical protein B7Y05_13830 [Polynucleobacter sp. 24-46-87]OZA41401.1 MAG: hypothetical protein B7X83_02380 [Polynucleobacter sp. 17-46-58]OZB48021.1 MAG: hypothetical protein B7X60_04915 [Polynucleobacter sp. 39-45-136]HQR84431.1 hypothetical protein [Polynucleobacter sp.]